MQNQRGCFITLEGLDGAGKSTHVQWLVDRLRDKGLQVLSTREPGGTELGERLRDILLSYDMRAKTEALQMLAARGEHGIDLILPALQAGTCAVCARCHRACQPSRCAGRHVGRYPV